MKFYNQRMRFMSVEIGADTSGGAGGEGTPAEDGDYNSPDEFKPKDEIKPIENDEAEGEDKSVEEQLEAPKSLEDVYEGSEFFEAAMYTLDKADILGDVVMDEFLKSGEFHPDHVALMQKNLGKAQAQILMQGIKSEVANQAATEQQAVQDVYEAVGGEENFKAAAAWAASEESGFDQQEKDDMNKMLGMGGNMSKWAAQLLMIGFSNAGGVELTPAENKPQLLEGKRTENTGKGIQPITFNEYRAAQDKVRTQAEQDVLTRRANYTMGLKNFQEYGFKYH